MKQKYAIVFDTEGEGLETFSFGLFLHKEGQELEIGIATALYEYFEKDFEELEQSDIDFALERIVLLEPSKKKVNVKLSKIQKTEARLDIF